MTGLIILAVLLPALALAARILLGRPRRHPRHRRTRSQSPVLPCPEHGWDCLPHDTDFDPEGDQ